MIMMVFVYRRDQILLEKTELTGIKSELKVNNLYPLAAVTMVTVAIED